VAIAKKKKAKASKKTSRGSKKDEKEGMMKTI